jgi:hypothetical protein
MPRIKTPKASSNRSTGSSSNNINPKLVTIRCELIIVDTETNELEVVKDKKNKKYLNYFNDAQGRWDANEEVFIVMPLSTTSKADIIVAIIECNNAEQEIYRNKILEWKDTLAKQCVLLNIHLLIDGRRAPKEIKTGQLEYSLSHNPYLNQTVKFRIGALIAGSNKKWNTVESKLDIILVDIVNLIHNYRAGQQLQSWIYSKRTQLLKGNNNSLYNNPIMTKFGYQFNHQTWIKSNSMSNNQLRLVTDTEQYQQKLSPVIFDNNTNRSTTTTTTTTTILVDKFDPINWQKKLWDITKYDGIILIMTIPSLNNPTYSSILRRKQMTTLTPLVVVIDNNNNNNKIEENNMNKLIVDGITQLNISVLLNYHHSNSTNLKEIIRYMDINTSDIRKHLATS